MVELFSSWNKDNTLNGNDPQEQRRVEAWVYNFSRANEKFFSFLLSKALISEVKFS